MPAPNTSASSHDLCATGYEPQLTGLGLDVVSEQEVSEQKVSGQGQVKVREAHDCKQFAVTCDTAA
jgi:hypothetical protein